MRGRLKMVAYAVLGLLALAGPTAAQQGKTTKIKFGYVISADFTSAFIAQDKGFFKKRGLDVEFIFVPLNSTTLPAALQSKSIDIAGITPTVLLQAIDGGLDIVGVAGGGFASKGSTNFAVLERSDLSLKSPADFAGRKIGAPGIGSVLHVLFRNWLIENGVDPKRPTYIETSYPTMPDVLRSKNVDAVIVSDPTMSRMVEAGTGKIFAHFTDALPGEVPIIMHCALRDWVSANPDAVNAFRESVAEGVAYAAANEKETREIMAKYLKLPEYIAAKMQLPRFRASLTEENIKNMIGIMQKQDMLQTKIDPARVILK